MLTCCLLGEQCSSQTGKSTVFLWPFLENQSILGISVKIVDLIFVLINNSVHAYACHGNVPILFICVKKQIGISNQTDFECDQRNFAHLHFLTAPAIQSPPLQVCKANVCAGSQLRAQHGTGREGMKKKTFKIFYFKFLCLRRVIFLLRSL